MEKLRARIDTDPESIQNLNNELENQTEFILEGPEYARPKCDKNALFYSWYNKKTFSLIHEEKVDETVFSQQLVNRLTDGFMFLVPFYKYFSTLDEDPDPNFKF